MSVPAVCVGDKELLPLRPHCGITVRPKDLGDQHLRRWVRIARFECRGTFVPFMHHDCIHNHLVAVRNRVLADVPQPTKEGLKVLKKQARKLVRHLPRVSPDDWYVMPNLYRGAKRARYVTATDNLLVGGLTQKHARVTCFSKAEKLDSAGILKYPRAIQFRHAKYCVALARYLKPCEHPIYRFRGDGRHFPATRLIGKGLSQAARAKLLVRKLSAFSAPRIVSLDATKFDLHVSLELLQIEHWVYLQMCQGYPEFAKLLSWQLYNEGFTRTGIRYQARGGRMSGDMNTALGNCVLMILMVSAFMAGRKYDVLDDGDDCLLIVEESELSWVLENAHATFLTFGMEIKVENVAATIEGVEWCQSHPVQYAPGAWKFVRNPYKVFSTCMGGVKYVDSDKARRKLLNTIGMAEMVLNLGVPVMQSFAQAIMRNAATTQFIELQEADPMYYRLHHELKAMNLKQLSRLDPRPITDTARHSFWLAFGIPVCEQLEMEAFFSSWSFPIAGTDHLLPEFSAPTWCRRTNSSQEASSLWE